MFKKFLFTIVLFILCFSNLFGANGFFFEGGIGGRSIGGGIEYVDFSSKHYFDAVTDDNSLGWNNKILTNINGTFGFRFNEKYVTNISVQYFAPKAGYGNRYRPVIGDIIVVGVGKNFASYTQNADVATSWFDMTNLQVTQNVYVHKSIFLIVGVEYLSLKLDLGGSTTFKDNTFGYLAGVGYELPVSSSMSMIATGVYSFTSYDGDELLYEILDFEIGGLELGYTLRYYLK